MAKIMRIESISQINEMIGNEKLKHPLITLIEPSKVKMIPVIDQKITMNLYSISLKNGHECKIKYGRQNYDFQEGTLMCLAPGQTIEPFSMSENIELDGWVLIFHPDLISKSALGKKINEYTFFTYDSHEALHLSEQERQTVTEIVKAIKYEYSQNLDVHSQDLIISNLELLLNYCKRFYGRQFITRTNVQKDVVIRFEAFINSYFDSDKPESQGLPSVRYCAQEMCYSPNYLSDLLKKETGKSVQEHIHFYLVEKAKIMLLGTQEPVNRIAHTLGFEYPQHFSKLFKNITGISPSEYRN
ncbi:MAG: AraC family transcriptional regulator [Firmicutes bacterium HGW-Firmicutes-1]|jgi:AraC-like DNA-binding protein|nr:MAG: AraC family transcriptional regulator [Firmicutes bacterium HGW-Firmicutes-1]